MADVTCPECGAELSGGDAEVYKHAVSCFHLPDRGREQVLADMSTRDDEYARRVRKLLGRKARTEV